MSDEQRYDEFAKRMEEKYPAMYGGDRHYGGFAIGEGWWPIIEALSAQIDHHIKWNHSTRERLIKDNPYGNKIPEYVEPVVVVQVKEKFGGLRFYYEGGDDMVDGMVRMAESWAARACEKCGAPGKSRSGGWIRTLCDKHEEEYQARMKEQRGNGV